MHKVLTIAIPTFNRKDKLERCLESVIRQADDESIEVLVSDNASDDGTEPFMNLFIKAHPQVQYFRNESNLGPDRNFLNCYERAAGDYVLLIGDDDILMPEALGAILEALRLHPVFVHLNTGDILSENPLSYSLPRFAEGPNEYYHSAGDIFLLMGVYVTYVSSLILKTELVRSIQYKERFVGTFFLQSHVALETLRGEGIHAVVKKYCIAATGNDSVNYDLYDVWGRQYHDLLYGTALSCGIDREAVNSVYLRSLSDTILAFVLQFRKTCPDSNRWKKEQIMKYARRIPDLRRVYSVAVYAPLPIARLWYRLHLLLADATRQTRKNGA